MSELENNIDNTYRTSKSDFSNELRKRRGSFPQLSHEVLPAEMLAPLPQGNISKTASNDILLDEETKPLLNVSLFNTMQHNTI